MNVQVHSNSEQQGPSDLAHTVQLYVHESWSTSQKLLYQIPVLLGMYCIHSMNLLVLLASIFVNIYCRYR